MYIIYIFIHLEIHFIGMNEFDIVFRRSIPIFLVWHSWSWSSFSQYFWRFRSPLSVAIQYLQVSSIRYTPCLLVKSCYIWMSLKIWYPKILNLSPNVSTLPLSSRRQCQATTLVWRSNQCLCQRMELQTFEKHHQTGYLPSTQRTWNRFFQILSFLKICVYVG